ncbi:MAG: hypothetical protein K2X84_13000 [Beijerinckiaceae bacterium]|nr:hypothetical protein [Beijerinckiaceae bacterium]
MQVLTKGEFARHAGVSPGRVSQWIAEGKIGPDALEGEGRSAKIIVERALDQIKARRDVGQSLGNGLGTRVFASAPAEEAAPALPPRTDDVAYQIQLERLKSERRKNERESVEEALRQQKLVPADDVRSAMARLARQVDDANGAMLADFASAIAGRFGLPQRDVLHLLREVRNQKKGAASKIAAATAEGEPETVEFTLEDDAVS